MRAGRWGLVASCQVLVTHDLLGMFDRFTPRFVKRYAELHQAMGSAFEAFRLEVSDRRFPGKEHGVEMDDADWDVFVKSLDRD